MINSAAEKNDVTFIKQVELKSIIIKLRSDGIMQFDFKPCDEFTVNDLKEANAATDVLGEDKIFPRLVFVNHFIRFDKDVRAQTATEESNLTTLAAAFVTNILALKFIGNFYVSFNKPARPTRIFSSEAEAVEWLKSFIQA